MPNTYIPERSKTPVRPPIQRPFPRTIPHLHEPFETERACKTDRRRDTGAAAGRAYMKMRDRNIENSNEKRNIKKKKNIIRKELAVRSAP